MKEIAKDFASLAAEDWRIIVDENELNEPTIAYRDRERSGCFVGPIVKVPVGTTVESEGGTEVLDLDWADGRTLFAVAFLPQIAELFAWAKMEMAKLNAVHFDSQNEYGRFMIELRERMKWISEGIDDRENEMGPGEHGFERYKRRAVKSQTCR